MANRYFGLNFIWLSSCWRLNKTFENIIGDFLPFSFAAMIDEDDTAVIDDVFDVDVIADADDALDEDDDDDVVDDAFDKF